jgi:hypothetical protein
MPDLQLSRLDLNHTENSHMMNIAKQAMFAGCALVLSSAAAAAQRPDGPVIIAITDTLPSRDARAVVMRYPREPHRDIIILKGDDASVELLGGALAMLEQRRGKGRKDAQQEVVTIQGVAIDAVPAKMLPVLKATLERLSEQPVVRIGNLGRGRWLQMPGTRKKP